MQQKKIDLQLRERVKELKCLYELSRIAWEADQDLEAVINKALSIPLLCNTLRKRRPRS